MSENLGPRPGWKFGSLILIAAGAGGLLLASQSLPGWQHHDSGQSETASETSSSGSGEHSHSGGDAHGGHAHPHDSHHGHSHGPAGGQGNAPGNHDANALRLSAAALRNVGLSPEEIRRVELTTFWRTISLPAQIAGRDGRTEVQVATPMTGIITHVNVPQGAAVSPRALLFRIRLTHEDLLQLQTEFLQTIEELDVEEREIRRLTEATRSQAIPGRLLLEREYQRDKLRALRAAQQESLRLHGLTEDHLRSIVRDRRLIRELNIFAPAGTSEPANDQLTPRAAEKQHQTAASDGSDALRHPLVLDQLNAHQGQVVPAGTTLCVLKDYSELLIEGFAFHQDIPALRTALQEEREVTAVLAESGQRSRIAEGLHIEHLANAFDTETRSLRFFVRLPNRILNDRDHQGVRFIEWDWLTGQRVQLRIPLGRWKNQIVLPDEAVAAEGSANYVFRKHGEHFDRVPVRIRHRDSLYVVVERDGAISPGNEIAWQGAHQMQMALRRQSAGPVDAHHGHTH